MKKLAIVLVGVLMMAPTVSFAATTQDEQYHAILVQLISLLEKQIEVLQTQLVAQQAESPATATTTVKAATTASSTPIEQQCGLVEDARGDFHRNCSQ